LKKNEENKNKKKSKNKNKGEDRNKNKEEKVNKNKRVMKKKRMTANMKLLCCPFSGFSMFLIAWIKEITIGHRCNRGNQLILA
jgi:hypothetical protein